MKHSILFISFIISIFTLTSCYSSDKGEISDYTNGQHDSRIIGNWELIEGPEAIIVPEFRAADGSNNKGPSNYYIKLTEDGKVLIYSMEKDRPLDTVRKTYYKTKGNKTLMLLNVGDSGKSATKNKVESDYRIEEYNTILKVGGISSVSKYKRYNP
ncbi:hypothetical protein [Falsiporphyromonas endometrii]|uniref:Lipocalin-like domain-containing protein n=1 Tax=Falsiporphyromonas endometrii TaxID=1387297 RepID=A0ABV9K920_9PORP